METSHENLPNDQEVSEPPVWHDEVLASRKQEWENCASTSEDWNDVKRILKISF